jgi:hypothetical protein
VPRERGPRTKRERKRLIQEKCVSPIPRKRARERARIQNASLPWFQKEKLDRFPVALHYNSFRYISFVTILHFPSTYRHVPQAEKSPRRVTPARQTLIRPSGPPVQTCLFAHSKLTTCFSCAHSLTQWLASVPPGDSDSSSFSASEQRRNDQAPLRFAICHPLFDPARGPANTVCNPCDLASRQARGSTETV